MVLKVSKQGGCGKQPPCKGLLGGCFPQPPNLKTSLYLINANQFPYTIHANHAVPELESSFLKWHSKYPAVIISDSETYNHPNKYA